MVQLTGLISRKHYLSRSTLHFGYVQVIVLKVMSFFAEKGLAKPEALLYRRDDFFHELPVDFTEEDIEILKNGCRQVLEGRGLTADFPFINLEVGGFYALFRMFHYESESRKTKYSFHYEGEKGILDHITFAHIVDGNIISYSNFVGQYTQLHVNYCLRVKTR